MMERVTIINFKFTCDICGAWFTSGCDKQEKAIEEIQKHKWKVLHFDMVYCSKCVQDLNAKELQHEQA